MGRLVGLWGGFWGCEEATGTVGRLVGLWGGCWDCGEAAGTVRARLAMPYTKHRKCGENGHQSLT